MFEIVKVFEIVEGVEVVVVVEVVEVELDEVVARVELEVEETEEDCFLSRDLAYHDP